MLRHQEAFLVPLSAPEIRRCAGDGVAVECVATTASTNADLLARARELAPVAPLLRATIDQTAGRGRHGRRWLTGRGSALMFSLARAWGRASDGSGAQASSLAAGGSITGPLPAAVTLACGVAVAETLRARGANVFLKWPNDVLFDGGKLAGILTELAVDAAGQRTLVVGVGINLWFDAETRRALADAASLPPASLDACFDLAQLARERERWIGELAVAMLDAIDLFARGGFAALQPRYDALLAFSGADVQLLERDTRVAHGRLIGVDALGQLRLQTARGERTFVAGEVSLRGGA